MKDCKNSAELIIEHDEKEQDIFNPNLQIFQYKKKITKINNNTHDKFIENDSELDKTPINFIPQNPHRLWPSSTWNEQRNSHLDNDKVKNMQFGNMLEQKITRPEIISAGQSNYEPKQKKIKLIPENYKKKWIQKYENDKFSITHHQNEHSNDMKSINGDDSFRKKKMSTNTNLGIQCNEINSNDELVADPSPTKYMHSSINQFQKVDFPNFTDSFAITFGTNQ